MTGWEQSIHKPGKDTGETRVLWTVYCRDRGPKPASGDTVGSGVIRDMLALALFNQWREINFTLTYPLTVLQRQLLPGPQASIHFGHLKSHCQVLGPSTKSLLRPNWVPKEEQIDCVVKKGPAFSRVFPSYTQAVRVCVSLY